jgi:hypothetical protein
MGTRVTIARARNRFRETSISQRELQALPRYSVTNRYPIRVRGDFGNTGNTDGQSPRARLGGP